MNEPRPKKSITLPLTLLVLLCLVLAAVVANIVYLRAHQKPAEARLATPTPEAFQKQTPEPSRAADVPVETATPVPAAESSEPPVWQFDSNDERFWKEDAIWLSGSYRSPDLSVTVETVVDTETFHRRVTYYVADIYVRDVTHIQTASCRGDCKLAGHGDVEKAAKRVNALVAISGDYCGFHRDSLVIRNGTVYRKSVRTDMDVCLLLRDGTMETVLARNVNLKKILEKDPWQAWQFGPALTNSDGSVRSVFPDSSLNPRNPRSCIGYVEPGHYKFVVVDGRQKQSRGVTLKELAVLMNSLGCCVSFNLDGGNSAHFFWEDTIFSNPSGGGREISDIIYVAKEEFPASVYYHGKDGLHL